MWAFVLTVLLFNLIFMCLLFFIRHMIAITTPVLVMTALVAFFCTITFPYLAAIFDYGYLALIFCFIILCFSVLLTLADKKYPAQTLSAAGTDCCPSGQQVPNSGLNTTDEKKAVEITALVTAQDPKVIAHQLPETLKPLQENESENQLKPEPQPPEEMGKTTPEKMTQSTGLENELALVHTAPKAESSEICDEIDALVEDETADEANDAEILDETKEVAAEGKPDDTDLTQTILWPREYSAAVVTESNSVMVVTKQTNLNSLINLGFDRKQNGDYLGAATTFFSVLQMQPEPGLAILLAVEISDIYREAGQFWQAAEILNILLDSWRNELDTEKVIRLEIKINQLHELLNKKGVKA
ncbi:MAG TPA: hypothetical protein DEF34_05560 [Desulfotomaculum sp.]|nr:MAG: hypothetical protein JL56_11005 [Desulfotomaculum sp. BICA1-6]HBX23083.1 hypothetical protein [Desulfotomaculum sp.]